MEDEDQSANKIGQLQSENIHCVIKEKNSADCTLRHITTIQLSICK